MMWEEVRFGDLYATPSRNGVSKPSKIRGEGYKMINMGELFSNDRIYDIDMELVPLKENEKMNAKVEVDDLLFARQSLVLAGAGKCSIVKEVSDLTVFESHLIRVRLLKSTNPTFYYYYFKSPLSPIKTIVNQCAQSGIRGSDLQELSVIHPPIETQKHIADILSAYDELIENNQKQIKLLEEMAQRLYKEWFVDLRFPNYENTEIVDGVPKGWEVKKIKDIAKTTSGGTPSRSQLNFYNNGANMWIKTKELQDGFIFDSEEKISNEAIKRSSAKVFEANSLLVAMYGATIGKLGISTEASTCNQACCVFEPSKSNLPIEFIYCWLYQDRQKLISAGKGSAQPNLSQVIIGNFDILVPSETVMKVFSKISTCLFAKKKELQKQNTLLQQARDRLLPKLMSGELEV